MCTSSSRKTQIQNMEISQGSICIHAWGDPLTLSLMMPGFLRSWPDSCQSVHCHGFISLLYQCYPNPSHQSSPLAAIPVQSPCTLFSWASGQPQLVKATIRSWPCFMHITPLSPPSANPEFLHLTSKGESGQTLSSSPLVIPHTYSAVHTPAFYWITSCLAAAVFYLLCKTPFLTWSHPELHLSFQSSGALLFQEAGCCGWCRPDQKMLASILVL